MKKVIYTFLVLIPVLLIINCTLTIDNCFAQLLAVDSVSPHQNKLNVLLTSDLKAYFNQNMNGTTMDSNSVTFFGSMTGRKHGVITYNSGNKIMQIVPNNPFKYGELISTTLDSGIKTGLGNSIIPFVWSFTTLSKPSNMVFNKTDTVVVGSSPLKITTGDFNGDGVLDLAVSNSASNSVSILLNNGNGNFIVSSVVGVGNSPSGIVTGDFDEDSDLDLAVANGVSNTVSILKNNGSGTFILSSTVSVGGPAGGIVTGDIDGDGDLDLVTTNRGSNNISILKNNGTGTFSVSSTNYASSAQGISIGDFDNDGDLDLCIGEYWASRVSIFKNDRTGAFALSSTHGVGSNTDQVVTGDFDNDGDLDLAVTNNGSSYFSILINNGTGIFTVSNVGASGLTGITQGDFDGDGDLDLAVNVFGQHKISLFKNGGTGSFTLSSTIGAGTYPFYITAGDFNNNGVTDIAVTNYYNSIITVLMNLTPPQLLSPANNSTGNLNSLNFTWKKSKGASNYRFQLATDSLFSNIVVNDSTLLGTDSAKAVSGLNILTWYYWRMNSKSANGTSLWSDTWKFKTQGIPSQVVLLYPPDDTLNIPVNVNFIWSKANDQKDAMMTIKLSRIDNRTVSRYWFVLTTDTAGTPLIIDSTLTDTTKLVNGLYNLSAYYWRVKAKNEIGWGVFSSWFKFTTIVSAPLAPVLVSPVNGAILVATNPLLDWDSSATAESYRVQVSTDSLFTSPVYDSSGITITEFQIPNNGLNINTTYYWRVNATNVGGTSSYSTIFHFTTGTTNLTLNNEIPKEFKLYNSYPNPFNPNTIIRFDIPKTSLAMLIIYDALGRKVSELVNEKLSAGSYEVDWNGSGYASGVYFYKLITDEYVNVKKMVLLK